MVEVQPVNGTSFIGELFKLRHDIALKRAANHDERKRAKWSMREVDVATQHDCLNFVEQRLAELTKPFPNQPLGSKPN